jgi:hypothetical protein
MRKIQLFLIMASACLVSLHCSTTVSSADLDSAKAAYDNGDFVTAFQKFSTLAKRGNAEAQFYLADMFFGGDGAPQNYAEAIKWYIKAANQGHVNAQYNLGVLYATGQGVPKNHAEAARWFRMAADQGDGEAQHNLGLMYFKGEGVQQDNIQSYMWLILADKNGSPRAEEVRQLVAAKMTPEQRAESQKLSTAWKPNSR